MSAIAASPGPGTAPAGRLELLCDPGSLEPWQAHPGICAPVAVVAARGAIAGRPVLCYAHDFSVAGGSVGEAEATIISGVLWEAHRRGVPVVSFMESAGARLQEGVKALGAYASIFAANVALSRQVPQVSVITGTAAGGGCYSPALTDVVIMTREASMFLTGPRVVQEALQERITADALGGTRVHERNGVCHLVAGDVGEAADLAREVLEHLPLRAGLAPPRRSPEPPSGPPPDAYVPDAARRVYDVRDVAAALVDGGRIVEIAPKWGRNLVTALARIEGRPVGIVANQPRVLGGVLDVVASSKGAEFVDLCNAYGIPLAVLVDTPGFMPGSRQEGTGVIRQGAKLVHAFASATVPRATVILRKAYGGAYIAMNSKNLGATFTAAWPGAEIGIMSGRAAAQILHRGRVADATDPEAELLTLARAYASDHLSCDAALDAGLLDAVFEPAQTRAALARSLAG